MAKYVRLWSLVVCGACLLAPACLESARALAQQPENSPPTELRYDTGTIAGGVYRNECLGFSFPIPEGWTVNTQAGGSDANGRATHLPEKGLLLLTVDRDKDHPFQERVVLSARDAADSAQSAKDYADSFAQGQNPNRESIQEAAAVEYGSKPFYRSGYKQNLPNGGVQYLAFIFTKFRGYLVGGSVIAGSAAEMDDAADTLKGISFGEDQVNPKCVFGDAPVSGGVTRGIIGSAPSGGPKPTRVRVSEGVSRGLLVTKVNPEYPEEARKARIQGLVVLQATIDPEGNVRELNLISGHPLLAPAAIAAVKEWKYKPYLLNNQPLTVETQITVSFQLQDR